MGRNTVQFFLKATAHALTLVIIVSVALIHWFEIGIGNFPTFSIIPCLACLLGLICIVFFVPLFTSGKPRTVHVHART